jgi:hypothetical protein
MGLVKLTKPDGSLTSLKNYIFENWFLPLGSTVQASTLFAIAFIVVMYVVVWGMWKKKIFIKV